MTQGDGGSKEPFERRRSNRIPYFTWRISICTPRLLNYPPSFSLQTSITVPSPLLPPLSGTALISFPFQHRPHLLPFPAPPFLSSVSSLLLGTDPAPLPLALASLSAPFSQTGPNRGPLFSLIWPNKGHSVRPDRPGRTEALCSAKQNQTEALNGRPLFGQTGTNGGPLFSPVWPNGAESRREPIPGSVEETGAKEGVLGEGRCRKVEGYWGRGRRRETEGALGREKGAVPKRRREGEGSGAKEETWRMGGVERKKKG